MVQHLKCDYAVMIVYCIYSVTLLRLTHNSADFTAISYHYLKWHRSKAKFNFCDSNALVYNAHIIVQCSEAYVAATAGQCEQRQLDNVNI